MAVPPGVIDYLNETAQREGLPQPQRTDDLFATNVLDSFSLVDFVTVLEEHCNIKIPDADVNPGTFQTIEKIETYISARQGEKN